MLSSACRRNCPGLEAYKGRLGTDPETLADALDRCQSLALDAQRIAMYAYLDYSVDTLDQAAGVRTGQASTLSSQVQAALAFVEPELMAIGFETLAAWMETEPRLALYRHYFDAHRGTARPRAIP